MSGLAHSTPIITTLGPEALVGRLMEEWQWALEQDLEVGTSTTAHALKAAAERLSDALRVLRVQRGIQTPDPVPVLPHVARRAHD